MELKLDNSAIEELFKQYSTPAIKSEIRKTVKKELVKITEEEVSRKVSAFLTTQKIEEIFRDVLKKDIFKSLWAHERDKPLSFHNEIVLDEFKNKAKLVNFDRVEELVLEECRVMIDGKMKRFKNIAKMIDEELL